MEAYITELGLHQGDRLPNTVALYSRPPSAEGEGEQTVSDLIRRATRRLNPTRVIVGEILGDEVGPVLDVFSGSTRGSGCTIHARSARGAVRRFEQYGLLSLVTTSVPSGRVAPAWTGVGAAVRSWVLLMTPPCGLGGSSPNEPPSAVEVMETVRRSRRDALAGTTAAAADGPGAAHLFHRGGWGKASVGRDNLASGV